MDEKKWKSYKRQLLFNPELILYIINMNIHTYAIFVDFMEDVYLI